MTRSRLPLIASLAALPLLVASSARADDSAPANYDRRTTQTQYPAPLSQTTQPSYVPQSVALSGPHEIDEREDGSVPPGYTPVERVRKGPIIGGSITFGALYLLSAFSAAVASDAGDKSLAPLYVPVVGPIIQMAKTDSATGNFVLAIDAVGQGVGAGLLIFGLTSRKTVLVRNDIVGEVHVVPMVSASSQGVGLGGTF
jgi:hypothetical protein